MTDVAELFNNTEFLQRLRREAYLEALSAIRREVSDVNNEFLIEVAKGNVPGHSLIHQYGRNPDTDPAASATAVPVGRDLWHGGIAGAAAWVPPTDARIHQLASTDDEDGGAGTDTGALTCHVGGLDTNYKLVEETVTLNGTTDAPTAKAYRMIHHMEILTAGSAGRNLGVITATADTDATVTDQIPVDRNHSASAMFMIPAGKTGYLLDWGGDLFRTAGVATTADLFLMEMPTGGVWAVRDDGAVVQASFPHFRSPHEMEITFPAKALVKVIADPSAVAQDMGGSFSLLLIDDGR